MEDSLLFLLRDDALVFALLIPALIAALVLHEVAHAATAMALGDRLPRATGRTSLNPTRHLDPVGTIFLLIVGFGWARPVEFRPEAFRSRRAGTITVALAGPAMNLGLAAAGAIALGFLHDFGSVLNEFLGWFVLTNVVLALFNLVPLPPLDGERLLAAFLPPRKRSVLDWLDRWGLLVLLALLLFGGWRLLTPLITAVVELLDLVAPGAGLPAGPLLDFQGH